MDYYRIIHQPGYRREDLKEEDRRVLSYLDELADEVLAVDPVEIDEEADVGFTTIGNIKREIMQNAFHVMHDLLKLKIAEIQIGMAERGDQRAIERDELPLCEYSSREGGGGRDNYAGNRMSQIIADQPVFTRSVNVVAKEDDGTCSAPGPDPAQDKPAKGESKGGGEQ